MALLDLQRYCFNLKLIKNMEVFWEFIHCFLKARNAQVTFAEKPRLKINCLNKHKHWYPMHGWSDKGLKVTTVNRSFPSLEITLTAFLFQWFLITAIWLVIERWVLSFLSFILLRTLYIIYGVWCKCQLLNSNKDISKKLLKELLEILNFLKT